MKHAEHTWNRRRANLKRLAEHCKRLCPNDADQIQIELQRFCSRDVPTDCSELIERGLESTVLRSSWNKLIGRVR